MDEEEEEDGHGTIPGPDFHGECPGESQLHSPLGPSFCSLVRALRGINRGLIFPSVFKKHCLNLFSTHLAELSEQNLSVVTLTLKI